MLIKLELELEQAMWLFDHLTELSHEMNRWLANDVGDGRLNKQAMQIDLEQMAKVQAIVFDAVNKNYQADLIGDTVVLSPRHPVQTSMRPEVDR